MYKRAAQYVFVLKPPLRGISPEEFLRVAQDLKSGVAVTSLIDNNSVPHSSLAGKELTLQFLKDEVTAIVSRNPVEWIRGCDGISVMHHPEMRGKLVSILSKQPESAEIPGEKLLSVTHGLEAFAFKVRLQEVSLMPTDGMLIGLDNPTDPAAGFFVPSNRRAPLTLTNIYESKQKMEYFAMTSFCEHLISISNATQSDLKPRYEPLGQAFPDFELLVREQEWAVEVTRIETGMISYLRVSKTVEQMAFERVVQRQVTDSGIIEALMKALDDKTSRRMKCSRYSRACLLLVDIVDSIDAKSSATWDGIDLSAFDAVALVKMDGSVTFITGMHSFKSAS